MLHKTITDTLITLFCLVDGESTSFPVKIESTETVGDLKKLIKTETPDTFNGVDAKDLILWKVSIPVAPKKDRKEISLDDTKLYNLRIDEAIEWIHDEDWKPVSLETWRCPPCDQRTRKSEKCCKFCNAPQPGPRIPNTTPISKLRAMEQKKSDNKEPSTSNLAASTSSSTASTSIAGAPTSISATITNLFLLPSHSASPGSAIGSSQITPTPTTTASTTTTAPVISKAASTLGLVTGSSGGIQTNPGMFPVQMAPATLSHISTVTAVPLATSNAAPTVPFNFSMASSSLHIPQPVQRMFQFGGFNAPMSFSFSPPTLTTLASTNTSSTLSNVLGLPNSGKITVAPATSMTAVPLSFNPFAPVSFAIIAPSASGSTPSVAAVTALSTPPVSLGSVMAPGPTPGAINPFFATASTTMAVTAMAAPPAGVNQNALSTHSTTTASPLGESIAPVAGATSAGPPTLSALNLASTSSMLARYNFFSGVSPLGATATTPSPPTHGRLGSRTSGFGPMASFAIATFNLNQQTHARSTSTSPSLGFGAVTQGSCLGFGADAQGPSLGFDASAQASNMNKAVGTTRTFGNSPSSSINPWASNSLVSPSGVGSSGRNSAFTSPPAGPQTTEFGSGASGGTSGM
ncbi:hypothetical protein BGZ47_002836 [Haplosporangium gracile]|nr:hypothetical protein BGZ47_002836 [Haplosporangium gracile]